MSILQDKIEKIYSLQVMDMTGEPVGLVAVQDAVGIMEELENALLGAIIETDIRY